MDGPRHARTTPTIGGGGTVAAAERPDRRTPAQRLGAAAERLVAERLTDAGWTVLGRNLHVGRREIDLLAIDPDPAPTLVVVEVRWRRSRSYGAGEETVDHRKRRRLHEAAFALTTSGDIPHLPLRFDLVIVEPASDGGGFRLRHHRAAF